MVNPEFTRLRRASFARLVVNPNVPPRPDLIMLDLNMPRVDGRQALTEIKADEDLRSIPTIVFTTSAADSDVFASYASHANAYVTKPLNLDDYERVVMQIRNFYGHTAVLPRRPSVAEDPDRSGSAAE